MRRTVGRKKRRTKHEIAEDKAADKRWDGDMEAKQQGRVNSTDATSVELRRGLLEGAVSAYRDHPRSQQLEVGPSQMGVTCDRQLVYDIHREEGMTHLISPSVQDNGPVQSDGWRATIGTATHAWLEGAYLRNPDRWIVEHRVTPTLVDHVTGEVLESVSGTADLYDRKLNTVIDHKVLGKYSMERLMKSGPSEKYRVQCHLYGLGFLNEGYPVKMVAIAAWPRDGITYDMQLWSEPFDIEIAEAALRRLKKLGDSMWDAATGSYVGVEGVDNFGLWDANPSSSSCRYCAASFVCPDSSG